MQEQLARLRALQKKTQGQKSQAFEQWQKRLQPASFQARRPLGIKQKSLGRGLATAGCRRGWRQPWVQAAVGCAGTALRSGAETRWQGSAPRQVSLGVCSPETGAAAALVSAAAPCIPP